MSNNRDEKLCLRWNDFERNISESFRELKNDKDFFDITLACAGGRQVQAHKVILSACSPFFKSILKQHPHQHPLVYLKGVQYEEVLSVVNFMYHGEVNVAQEDLTSFLAVAEELQVKGLTQDDTKETKSFTKRQPVPSKSPKKTKEKVNPMSKSSDHQKHHSSFKQGVMNIEQTIPLVKTEEPVLIEFDQDEEITAEPMLETEHFQASASGYDYDQDYEDQGQVGLYEDDLGHQGQIVDIAQGKILLVYRQALDFKSFRWWQSA